MTTWALTPATPLTATVPFLGGVCIPQGNLFAYLSDGGNNNTFQYQRNIGTGILTALSPASVANPGGPVETIASPDGGFIYVISGGNNNIAQYSRNVTTGLLTPLSPATIVTNTTFGSTGLVMSPDGTSLYTLQSFSSSNILQYSRNISTGLLTALSPATVSLGSGYVNALAISPDGLFVYVVNYGGRIITILSRNTSTGALTIASSMTISTGNLPTDIIISPDGAYAYTPVATSNLVLQHRRDIGTGGLTLLSPQYVNNIDVPGKITITTDGGAAYVSNTNSDSVSQYTRSNSTGLLTPLSPTTLTTNASPTFLSLSLDNAYLYVTTSAGIDIFYTNPPPLAPAPAPATLFWTAFISAFETDY